MVLSRLSRNDVSFPSSFAAPPAAAASSSALLAEEGAAGGSISAIPAKKIVLRQVESCSLYFLLGEDVVDVVVVVVVAAVVVVSRPKVLCLVAAFLKVLHRFDVPLKATEHAREFFIGGYVQGHLGVCSFGEFLFPDVGCGGVRDVRGQLVAKFAFS